MFRLIVLSGIFAFAFGQTKYCCTPDQWQGGVGEVIGSVVAGSTHLTTGNLTMSYDYTNRRMATSSYLFVDDQPQKADVILDYQKKMMYTIVSGQCTSSPLTGNMMKLCVPDSSVPVGKISYGVGASSLPVMAYNAQVDQKTNVYVTVTVGNPCAPVTEVVYGSPSNIPSIQAMDYYDISPGIADPSVFTPPSICNGQKMVKTAPTINHKLMNYIHSKVMKN